MTIRTPNLKLIACDSHILGQAIKGNVHLAELMQVGIIPQWTEFGVEALSYALEKISSDTAQGGWWTYLPIHTADNTLIGSGGFKGPPSESGEVEIGYEIAPLYRAKGLATEMAGGLIAHAFSYPDVKSVTAHTLAEVNSSVAVLRKLGFIQVEEFCDPDAGVVWKWVLIKI